MNSIRLIVAALLSGAFLHSPVAASTDSEDWQPRQAIQLVVPFAPGGGTDILARILAPELGKDLGRTVIVVNKPGASSIIGTETVVQSAADGHTLLLADTALMVNPSLQPNLPYDTARDLTPIVHIATSPVVLLVNPSVPANNVRELIELEGKKPGSLSYASGGYGSSTHLAGELFKLETGASITHVPYKGTGLAFADVVGGHVPMIFAGIGTAGQFVKDGKLRALAITGEQRHPLMPDVPTFLESGFPNVNSRSDWGILAKAGTPEPAKKRLNASINTALNDRDVGRRLAELAFDLKGGSPEEFSQVIETETKKWANVINEAKIKLE